MSPTSFASKLNEALIAAPWSLDRIVAMLAEQDLHISQATLSHWRSGRSVPKRANSFPVVTALEGILGLSPHSLHSLLQKETPARKNEKDYLVPPSGGQPDPIDSAFTFLFGESDKGTDWTNEVQRELMEQETVISADFLTHTLTFIILARVPQTRNPCLHISVGLDDTDVIPETGYVDVYNVKGATIGERILYADGRTTVTRLDLPDSCYPGQLRRISFTYSYQTTVPSTMSLVQAFAWPLHFYVNRVEFEGEVPETIEWVEQITNEDDDKIHTSISTRPAIPIGNTVQICIEKPTAKCGYFRWK